MEKIKKTATQIWDSYGILLNIYLLFCVAKSNPCGNLKTFFYDELASLFDNNVN